MTNKEAAYILSDQCYDYSTEELHTAFDLAIKALNGRPQGEWELVKENNISMNCYRCSNCNYVMGDSYYNFCPHCGADMRVKDEISKS